jgi:hypothetical protein
MRRSAALPIIALSLAIACDSTTAPDPNQGLGPSLQEGPSDQECVGFLPPGTYQNVFVPPGAFCVLQSSMVKGNLTAFEHSRLETDITTIRGSLKGLEGSTVSLLRCVVEGNIETDKAFHAGVGACTVRGNILVQGTSSSTVRVVGTEVLEGGIQIEKSAGGVVMGQVIVHKGNVKIEDNAGVLSIAGIEVAQNMQIFKNAGGGQVIGNTVGENLQCFENGPGFVGGPNFAAGQAEGQCFVGTP